MFSKSCEYAIKIMTYIDHRQRQDNEMVGLSEISQAIDSPKAFTAKILQQLTRAKLLESMRGRSGGFFIQKDKEVFLADIVQAIDGNKILNGCMLGFGECSAVNPCVVHHQLKDEREQLKEKLCRTPLHRITKKVNEQNAYFKE